MVRKCGWAQEDEDSGVWYTDCNNIFRFEEGTPQDNNFNFCCFCGDKLDQQEWEEPESEDEDEEE